MIVVWIIWALLVVVIATRLALAVRSRAGAMAVGAAILLFAASLDHMAQAGDVTIPPASVRYRLALERAAGAQFGVAAPIARLAAQIHQESAWNPRAASCCAEGMAQFTPATAAWLPRVCPDVGPPDPWDPAWAMRAMVCYDAWLLARAPGADACAHWAMTLSAYNGGERARNRERHLAERAGADPDRWFHNVATFRSRRLSAWRENRHYVRRVLLVIEPAYIAAGWPGKAVCHVR